MSTPEIQIFVRRAKQPALFSIVLYARSSRTTENSFARLQIQENASCFFILILLILLSIAKTARYRLASYSILCVKGVFRDGQNCC
jgi:hypothetical protein